MRKLLIIGISCSLLVGCATQKRVVETETKTQQQTAVEEKVQENSQKQTQSYGDSLTANGFIPADDPDPAPLTFESNGIKGKITLKPKYNPEGKLTGFQTEYQATAKPTTIVNENQSSTKSTQTQQSTKSQEQAADITKKKNGSVLSLLLAGAVLTLIFILFLVWLYYKLKNG